MRRQGFDDAFAGSQPSSGATYFANDSSTCRLYWVPTWLGIVNMSVSADITAASARWVAGLVETWKGRGLPKWPRWRK